MASQTRRDGRGATPAANKDAATPATATAKATRANGAPYLYASKADLYAYGNWTSAKDKRENDWTKATSRGAAEGLHVIGAFLPDYEDGKPPSIPQLSMALLRIAAYMHEKNVPIAWCCRAVAFLMDEIANAATTSSESKLDEIITLLKVSSLGTGAQEGEQNAATELREAAAAMTRTVDEQREELELIVKRTEASMMQAIGKAEEERAAAEQTSQGPRSYASVAAGENSRTKTREQIEMLGRAEERECQIRLERVPITDLTEKEMLTKAELAAKFAAAGGEVPTDVRFLAARRVAKDTVVLRLSSKAAVGWVKARMTQFTDGLGGQAIYKERLYNVIAEFVPKTFAPQHDASLRAFENDNNHLPNSLSTARYLKPVDRHSPTQRVAHVILGFAEPRAANKFLRDGAFIEGKRVRGRKLLSEPVRCLKCQKIGTGHVAATCPEGRDTCARCSKPHRTTECTAFDEERACSNCRAHSGDQASNGHGAADRQCPFFRTKLQTALERNPDAKYTYFPVPDDAATWIETGADSVEDLHVPDWQTIIRARSKRPGAAQHVAADIQRAMTGGARVVPAKGDGKRQTAITESFSVREPSAAPSSMVMETPPATQNTTASVR